MPSDRETVDVPPAGAAVARRYHRLERGASGAAALAVAGAVAAALLVLPFRQAIVASVAVLAVVRIPVFRTRGTARLASDDDPATVRADFASPTPPVLALQWGVADVVRRTDVGAVYEVSYLLGLRSTSLATEVRSDGGESPDRSDEPDADLELVVTAGGDRGRRTRCRSTNGTGGPSSTSR